MKCRSAPSSSRTTGTSSTLSGLACSSPFTSSIDRRLGTAVSWITARRRRPVAGYAVVLLGLILVGAIYATITGSGDSSASTTPTTSQAEIAKSQQIFNQTCSSCHGLQAQGTSVAPSLIGVGSAAVDFQVSTGRMPAKALDAEQPEAPRKLTVAQTRAVAAYVQSLGGGPPGPTAAEG